MTISTLAFGKASVLGSRSWSKTAARLYSAATPTTANASGTATAKVGDVAHQRELFVNVLNANATKRDAKQYLARFNRDPSEPSRTPLPSGQSGVPSHRAGPKRGAVDGPTRAIAENPQFVRRAVEEEPAIIPKETLHVALVALRAPQTIDDATLEGVALTLSQLVKLDMRIVLVLDYYDGSHSSTPGVISAKDVSKMFHMQGDRLALAMDSHSHEGARVVDGAFEIETDGSSATETTPKVTLAVPELILGSLNRAVIPIVPTLAYTPSGQLVSSSASSIMTALTHQLSGNVNESQPSPTSGTISTSVDRIILLDSLGGIPSKLRGHSAHVFVNLEQEFADINHELTDYAHQMIVESGNEALGVYEQHISNLKMVRDCLSMLPSASSALIITPDEAASSSQAVASTDYTIGAGTRRQKNALIHNLLTNKPMVSPSLPVARLQSTPTLNINVSEPLRSTLIKRGMSLTIIPNTSRAEGWQPPVTGDSTLDLEQDPRVDLSRLTYLIEDSFRRKIDMQHYLARIRGRTAGLIVAGSYDGGAILTWEQPPGTSDPARLVPYLDKFAVQSSSQGSAGVADILFQAMVQTCFPHGVCWRSRKDNPVNKWYFERADGHWQIPGTNWTMFWTGAGVVESRQRWEDYVAVCSNIEASWKDSKRPD